MSDAPSSSSSSSSSNTTSALRRPSTSSETSSLSSASTAYTTSKDKDVQIDCSERKTKRGLRQKARDMVHDIGSPPTARQDAKEGKPTLNHAPLGGMVGEPLTRPGKI